MSKFYDKLLFLLALIAFGACTAYAATEYLKGKGKTQKNNTGVRTSNEKPYEAVALPDTVQSWVPWSSPEYLGEDDDQWTYDLFTSAGVQWSRAEGAYQSVGTEPEPEVPFGLRLVSITRPVYELMLTGECPYRIKTATGFKDVSAPIITDVRTKQSHTIPEGYAQKSRDLDIVVKSYRSILDPKTGMRQSEVVIQDNKRKFTVTLPLGKVHEFKEQTEVVVALSSPRRSESHTWRKIGESWKVEGVGEYVLRGVNFEEKTITVEKNYEKTLKKKTVQKEQTETLSVSDSSDAKPGVGGGRTATAATNATNAIATSQPTTH
ncbi:MAG: hypothetical protein LBG65_02690 [Puniceicoccales bacterium]|jgi:hypothetical protein|nr:hypothetical protein [Puniceicoccales bacterium]